MSAKTIRRGYNPEDPKWFSEKATEQLKKIVEDYIENAWIVNLNINLD